VYPTSCTPGGHEASRLSTHTGESWLTENTAPTPPDVNIFYGYRVRLPQIQAIHSEPSTIGPNPLDPDRGAELYHRTYYYLDLATHYKEKIRMSDRLFSGMGIVPPLLQCQHSQRFALRRVISNQNAFDVHM